MGRILDPADDHRPKSLWPGKRCPTCVDLGYAMPGLLSRELQWFRCNKLYDHLFMEEKEYKPPEHENCKSVPVPIKFATKPLRPEAVCGRCERVMTLTTTHAHNTYRCEPCAFSRSIPINQPRVFRRVFRI